MRIAPATAASVLGELGDGAGRSNRDDRSNRPGAIAVCEVETGRISHFTS